ncbi:MAG: lytic transglycosylase domain-containing protein [Opitutaceae bacterium]|nr:lytic transglycosylase domain-containing protein [Opitutaceae bacterium]
MLIAPALFLALANRCAPEVAPGTLAAVAGAESGFNTLAIHDNTTRQSVAPLDPAGAIAVAKGLISAGHSVDLGLMQIDSANLSRLGLTVATAFDACSSVRAAGVVLSGDYQPDGAGSQAALLTALSRYNTGTAWLGFQNGYVGRVVATAKYVVPEIDPADSVASPKSPAAPGAPGWRVFNASPAAHPASPSQPPAPPAAPSWDVFPNSVGPAGFAQEHAVTLPAQRLPASGKITTSPGKATP